MAARTPDGRPRPEGAPRAHAFPRSRRLKRRRLIRPLFGRRGASRQGAGTVVVLYRTVRRDETGHDVGLQVGFAPGRRSTNAVRTRIRRLLRETFRQHQGDLLARFDGRPDCLTLMLLYRGPEAAASESIRRDLPRALARLAGLEIPAPSDGRAP